MPWAVHPWWWPASRAIWMWFANLWTLLTSHKWMPRMLRTTRPWCERATIMTIWTHALVRELVKHKSEFNCQAWQRSYCIDVTSMYGHLDVLHHLVKWSGSHSATTSWIATAVWTRHPKLLGTESIHNHSICWRQWGSTCVAWIWTKIGDMDASRIWTCHRRKHHAMSNVLNYCLHWHTVAFIYLLPTTT